jgi:hypothetical protein
MAATEDTSQKLIPAFQGTLSPAYNSLKATPAKSQLAGKLADNILTC